MTLRHFSFSAGVKSYSLLMLHEPWKIGFFPLSLGNWGRWCLQQQERAKFSRLSQWSEGKWTWTTRNLRRQAKLNSRQNIFYEPKSLRGIIRFRIKMIAHFSVHSNFPCATLDHVSSSTRAPSASCSRKVSSWYTICWRKVNNVVLMVLCKESYVRTCRFSWLKLSPVSLQNVDVNEMRWDKL